MCYTCACPYRCVPYHLARRSFVWLWLHGRVRPLARTTKSAHRRACTACCSREGLHVRHIHARKSRVCLPRAARSAGCRQPVQRRVSGAKCWPQPTPGSASCPQLKRSVCGSLQHTVCSVCADSPATHAVAVTVLRFAPTILTGSRPQRASGVANTSISFVHVMAYVTRSVVLFCPGHSECWFTLNHGSEQCVLSSTATHVGWSEDGRQSAWQGRVGV